jgi:uncharacterized membrane protein YfcA
LEGFFEAGLFGLIGFVAGCIGTLVGAGGGFLVVPALLHLWPTRSPEELTGTSLLVVFFNGFSAMAVYLGGAKKRRQSIDLKMGILLALAAIPGSLVGVSLFKGVSGPFFTGFFGVFLASMGIYSMLRSLRQQKRFTSEARDLKKSVQSQNSIQGLPIPSPGETNGVSYRGLLLGVFTGFLVSSLASGLGIGGGIFYVPLLVFGLKFPVHRATGTSQFVMTVMSAGAILAHASSGLYQNLPLFQILWLVVGAVLGAQVGARLGPRLGGSLIITGLSFLMVTIGLRLIFRAF